jgi:ATP-independent RNA helicase DbpA
MPAFASLTLSPALLQALEALGYTEMTPIQERSLPVILAGRDVTGQARTGTGKTVAFGLGLLAALDPAQIRLQGLVLCPTRELADQVSKAIRALARFIPNVKVLTLCGGIPLGPQLASLVHDPHVVVGTPGRIQELKRKGKLHFGGIKVAVLDEADRMLDMGFTEAIDELMAALPKQRQTLLYSATFPDAVRAVSRRFQREPADVTVEEAESAELVTQHFHEVEPAQKTTVLLQLLAENRPELALVFCNTRHGTVDLAAQLNERGVSALALHGELDQREREETLVRFANRSIQVLVATDVAARGLDIEDLPAVVSYELASDPDAHRHRIGRTGRAGKTGLALALVSARELPRARAIEEAHGTPIAWRKPIARRDGGRGMAPAPMVTLAIDGGRKDRMRAGDILGALTGSAGLAAAAVGKIDLFATRCYVAIAREQAELAMARLRAGKIKGRNFRVRRI